MKTSLDGLIADLKHAAGGGGARIARDAEADGKTELEVGRAMARPGPGLTELRTACGTAGNAPGAGTSDGEVVDRTARRMADDGAAMAVGKKR